jgi:hypothetical protein
MDDDQGDAGGHDPSRVYVSDEVVDRIYDAAHFLPAATEQFGGSIVHHMVWFRKATIGQFVQIVTCWREAGGSREWAEEEFRQQSVDIPLEGGRDQAEASRINALIIDEVYGPKGE